MYCFFPPRHIAVAGLSSLALWAAPLYAQESGAPSVPPQQIHTLPEIITIADPVPFEESLSDVTVLDAKAISQSGAASLGDLLARQPGIEIARNGGGASLSSIFMRGTNSGHVLVLVDGVRTASASTGATAIEALPLAQIERIEILRGAASSLYGADAVAGVINIISKKDHGGRAFTASADAACGTRHTCEGDVSLAGQQGWWRWSAGIGGKSSRGFNAIDNPANMSYVADRDAYHEHHQRWHLQLEPNAAHQVSLSYWRNELSADNDSGSAFPEYTDTDIAQTALSGSHALTSIWTLRWLVAELRNESTSTSWGSSYIYKTRTRQMQLRNEIRLATHSELQLALEHNEERLTGSTTYAADERDTNAIAATWRWHYGAHTAQLSMRNDHTQQYGSELTGGINYGYQVTPALQLIGGAGTAFKAPTFNDLYFPGYANPDLDPEKARMLEAGLRYTLRLGQLRSHWRLTGWQQRIRNMIVLDSAWIPQNVARADVRGATLTLDADWRGYLLAASFDWQKPEDNKSGNLLPRRAKTHGSLTLSKTLGDFYIASNLLVSSYRFDDAANTRRLGGYGIINLVGEWRAWHNDEGRALTFFAHLNNVFDKKYTLAADYAPVGVEAMLGVKGSW